MSGGSKTAGSISIGLRTSCLKSILGICALKESNNFLSNTFTVLSRTLYHRREQ